ncbi:hypothetical protein F5Y03DRAFT_403205 [Xylaria venustula]|nr:hypothetical protein F5Y03DRAFT_403205 [Xylaria venustula]
MLYPDIDPDSPGQGSNFEVRQGRRRIDAFDIDPTWIEALPADLQLNVLLNPEQYVRQSPCSDHGLLKDTNFSQYDLESNAETAASASNQQHTALQDEVSLPPGWYEQRSFSGTYYVNERLQVKTWRRPVEDDALIPRFPRVGSRLHSNFNPRVPPRLPFDFQVTIASESLDFNYPLSVYIVTSPVGPLCENEQSQSDAFELGYLTNEYPTQTRVPRDLGPEQNDQSTTGLNFSDEDGHRITLALSESESDAHDRWETRTLCKCTKRHLSRAEFADIESMYNCIYIGETSLSERKRDENACSIITSFPPYTTFRSNCQAFSLVFLDRACSTGLSSIDHRMLIHFAGFVHLPNFLNGILDVILVISSFHGEGSVERLSRFFTVIIAAFVAYSNGWLLFKSIFDACKQPFLTNYIARYWQGAVRLPRDATESTYRQNFELSLIFILYTIVHMTLFLFIVGFFISFLALNGEIIRTYILAQLQDRAGQYEPCMRTNDAHFQDILGHIINVPLAGGVSFVAWPMIIYQVFKGSYDSLPDTWYGGMIFQKWPARTPEGNMTLTDVLGVPFNNITLLICGKSASPLKKPTRAWS